MHDLRERRKSVRSSADPARACHLQLRRHRPCTARTRECFHGFIPISTQQKARHEPFDLYSKRIFTYAKKLICKRIGRQRGGALGPLARSNEKTGRLCRGTGQELFVGSGDVLNKKGFICAFLLATRNLTFVNGLLVFSQAFENLSLLTSPPVHAELL